MTELFSEPNLPSERLELLYQLSQMFNSSLDLEEVLNLVIDEVIAAVNAERGFVVLLDENSELDFRAARGIDKGTITQPEFQISRGVVGGAIDSGQEVLTSDAQQDKRFSARMSVVNLQLRSIMCTPLSIKGQVIGAIYVDNSLQSGIFTQPDLDLLSAIAASAAIAVDNARLYELAVEKGRIERDLQLASKVQSSLIPKEMPVYAGWEFAAKWIPARQVAGDFFDFFPAGDGLQGIVVADVVDKGFAAALFMATCRSVIRGSVLQGTTPQAIMRNANQLIHADSSEGNFVTLFYAQLNPQTGEMVYVNAGHNPPLLLRQDSNSFEELVLTGLVLGIMEDVEYKQHAVRIQPGELLFLYTDGVNEAVDRNGKEFGVARLKDFIVAHRQDSAEKICLDLEAELKRFGTSSLPNDDITVVVIKRLVQS